MKLTTSFTMLLTQTLSLALDGTMYHLVSYYRPVDIFSGTLQTPSTLPIFQHIDIGSDILLSAMTLRRPPRTGTDEKGRLVFV